MNTWTLGSVVRVTGTFTNSSGTAIDPTSVFFKFKTPKGTITSYTYGADAELVKSTTGIYYVDITTTMAGTWFVRFSSTATGAAAEEDEFNVRHSHF